MMTACIVSCACFCAAFGVVLYLTKMAYREAKEQEAAEIREMLRQTVRRGNIEWYINTRKDDARSDLIRNWEALDL